MGDNLFGRPRGEAGVLHYARILIFFGVAIVVVLAVGYSVTLAGRSGGKTSQPAAGVLYNITDEEAKAVETQARAVAVAWLGMAYPADQASFEGFRAKYLTLAMPDSVAAKSYAKAPFPAASAGSSAKVTGFSWSEYPYMTDQPCAALVSYAATDPAGEASTGTYLVRLAPKEDGKGGRTWLVVSDSGTN